MVLKTYDGEDARERNPNLKVGTGTTANAYATFLLVNRGKFKKTTIDIWESGGVNGITYKVEGAMYQGAEKELKGDTAISAGIANRVTHILTDNWVWLKVSIKSTVGGSHGTGNVWANSI